MAKNPPATAQGTAAAIAQHLQGAPADRERRGKLLHELLAAFDGGPDAVTDLVTVRFEALREDFVTQLEHLKEQL